MFIQSAFALSPNERSPFAMVVRRGWARWVTARGGGVLPYKRLMRDVRPARVCFSGFLS